MSEPTHSTPTPGVAVTGYVLDAGGGHVTIVVDRDTAAYPEVGAHVSLGGDPCDDLDRAALARALDKFGIIQWQGDWRGEGNFGRAHHGEATFTPEEHHALWVARHYDRGGDDA